MSRNEREAHSHIIGSAGALDVSKLQSSGALSGCNRRGRARPEWAWAAYLAIAALAIVAAAAAVADIAYMTWGAK